MFSIVRKKIVVLVFFTLLISDICSIVKPALDYNYYNYERFDIVYSIINGNVVLHLSLIYALIVLILYFGLNFFKTQKSAKN